MVDVIFIIVMLILIILFFNSIFSSKVEVNDSNIYQDELEFNELNIPQVSKERETKYFELNVIMSNSKSAQMEIHRLVRKELEIYDKEELYKGLKGYEIASFVDIGEKVYQCNFYLIDLFCRVINFSEMKDDISKDFKTIGFFANEDYSIPIACLTEDDYEIIKNYSLENLKSCYAFCRGGTYKTPYVTSNGEIKVKTLSEPYTLELKMTFFVD